MKKLINLVIIIVVIGGHTAFAQTVESYQHRTPDNKTMTVYYVLPPNINRETRVIFVMHGMNRNGKTYANNFRTLSIGANVAVIVPEFGNDNFNSNEYNLLNIRNKKSNSTKPYSEWTFHHVDAIFNDFVRRFGLSCNTYILYGHSAGGQFTARTSMFSRSQYLEYAIAANPGNYTFFDESLNYPNGIKNIIAYKKDLLENLSRRKLYILIGSKDTDQNDPNLSQSFNEQGLHRYERAMNFFENSGKYARQNNVNFNWKLTVMQGVGHNSSRTIPYVLDIITMATRPAAISAAANLSAEERVLGTWYADNNSVYVITRDTLTFLSSSHSYVVKINSFTAVNNEDSATSGSYPDGFRIRGARSVGGSFNYLFFPAPGNRSMLVRSASSIVYHRY
jgi:hypothetical protein